MNTRYKKRNNARILTIRTQWAKNNNASTIDEWLPNEADLFFDPCKSNPNTRLGFYMLTNPNPDPIISEEPQFDNETLEYLKSLWLDDDTITLDDDDTEFEMNNTFEVSL